MELRRVLWIVAVFAPVQAAALGVMYTHVGGGTREAMALRSMAVEVEIQDRLAITRVDQIFTNTTGSEVEGMCQLQLPKGALITDLVLWVGNRRVSGLVVDQGTVQRDYDPLRRGEVGAALIEYGEDQTLRLRVYPFLPGGSRRVEWEYMQLLETRDGRSRYAFPLVLEEGETRSIGVLNLQVHLRSQYPFSVEVAEAFRSQLQSDPESEFETTLSWRQERASPGSDFELSIDRKVADDALAVLSWKPPEEGEWGYYALWLPLFRKGATAAEIPWSYFRGEEVESVFSSAWTPSAAAPELFQVGRYRRGGRCTLEVIGDGERSAYSLELARMDSLQESAAERSMPLLLDHQFDDGRSSGWEKAAFTTGHWRIDGGKGFFTVQEGDSGTRAFNIVHSPSYTIETRLRFSGQEGKVIFQQADQNELWRLDLIASATARLTVGGRQLWGLPPAIESDVWYDVRVQVGNGVVSAFVNGLPTHENVPLGQVVPDGRIGVGSWEADAEFDYVRVYQGTQQEAVYQRTDTIARLWAYFQVLALEQQIAEYGPEEELLNHLMSLGFTYRLMSRMTWFFAPESGQ